MYPHCHCSTAAYMDTVDKYFKKSNIKTNKTLVKAVAKGKENDIINSGAVKGAI